MYIIKLKDESNGLFILKKNITWFYTPSLVKLEDIKVMYKNKGIATKGLIQANRYDKNIKIEDFEIREVKLTLI